ncbi:hypothetical protein F9817_14790 [Vibrio sp. CAIM 722]|uniref:Uncharacterized protein n=1 Tax=Vibrio eleionomae TaxID=2653505 RepID=A0A7X4RVE7_9VIBR|nr:hypothetical protein [Vibrio nitrifigilis]MZI94463.1 hypothetical protein [Vibrio eleionomae]
MYKIDFYLKENNKKWSAEIHQLNSDILERHIHPKITSNHYDIYFNYNEESQTGSILLTSGICIGSFRLH